MRLLAIDPGDKRIGLAISDAGGQLARPHSIIEHVSRQEDAEKISQVAHNNQVEFIIVGTALDVENRPTPQSRKAKRLAAALRETSGIEVIMWDESGSSQRAEEILRELSPKQRKNREIDDLAASVILQSYIENLNE